MLPPQPRDSPNKIWSQTTICSVNKQQHCPQRMTPGKLQALLAPLSKSAFKSSGTVTLWLEFS